MIMKTQGAKLIGEPTTIGMADLSWNLSVTLWGWYHLIDKLASLLEVHHAWQFPSHFLIKKSMNRMKMVLQW